MKLIKNGLEFWDCRKVEYGGHSFKLSKLLTGYKVNYCFINFGFFKFGRSRDYYDGWHNSIWLGVHWGS